MFLLWGLLQEKITSTTYRTGGGIYDVLSVGERFDHGLLLNFVQALMSCTIASLYQLYRRRNLPPARSVTESLGLQALTPAGCQSALVARGKSTEAHPKGISRYVSPLFTRYLLISALQSTASFLSIVAMRHLSYPAITLTKSSKLVPVLIMNILLYRRKFARYKYGVVFLVTLGVWMFMALGKKAAKQDAVGNSTLGLSLLIIHLILDGATNSTQDEVFATYGPQYVTGTQMMLVMNALSATYMLGALLVPDNLGEFVISHSRRWLAELVHPHWIANVLIGGVAHVHLNTVPQLVTGLEFLARHPDAARDVLCYGLVGAAGQVAIFETLERFGSLTLVSITHELRAIQWIGVVLVFAGLFIEMREKQKQGAAAKAKAHKINEGRRASQSDATISYVRRLAQATEARRDDRRSNALRKAREELGARYAVEGIVGEGGYGMVFSAVHKATGYRVAIKRISPFEHPLLTIRTLRELRLLRFFRENTACENIVRLLDAVVPGTCDNFRDVYLVQEMMDSDLHRVLRSQPLSYDHAQYFTYQILRGLKVIHAANVLHRDIKPSNLLVNANCDLKICDFGLARSLGTVRPETAEGLLTEYVATRWYRAPEIMLSSRKYSKAVDIWSVGCTLYEMLTGEPLFPGRDYHHQLCLILDVLGTPRPETLRPICSNRALEYIYRLPFRSEKPWRSLLPDVPADAIDFLARTVVLDPASRMTVEECLEHPFVAPYHDPDDEPCAPVLDPSLFAFDLEQAGEHHLERRQALWMDLQALFERPRK
ncbi:mitogen-activated protein kinase [Malassezia cuniculi]|uniref:Mitogen-activated protein kinase n=1 Tax=Malassezia cuniculi TaxID=948313 RepID=A0AAF0EW00_9BASI|nr:mitogen-activated protein kinase [Malassezia cuniculi]